MGSEIVQNLLYTKPQKEHPKYKIFILDRIPPKFPVNESEISFLPIDIRDPNLSSILKARKITTVVHLAAIVNPTNDLSVEEQFSIDVGGTENLLTACVNSGVNQIIVSSSGASYGYHADNPKWISEESRLRGNESFPYARHKRMVEEILSEYRKKYPRLKQCIFRIGTVMGAKTRNQITNLFEKPFLIGIKGSESPFVFIWDQDLTKIFAKAILEEISGIFNVAGDGKLRIDEIGKITGQMVIYFPPNFLKYMIRVLGFLRLTQYKPDQVEFLLYRPVLRNQKLKKEFGYIPEKNSREAFLAYWENRQGTRKKCLRSF